MTSSADAAHVEKLLTNLRDVPVNTEGASDSFLGPIFTYLMKISPNPSDGTLHWFCDRASQLTIEAATFLIRLFAYNSPRVDTWKEKFESCLGGCCNCVRGLEEAKVSSKST
jgi:senataxin